MAPSFQVSYLSTPLLAFLLLPTMIKTACEHSTVSRLVVVSSEMYYWASIEKEVRENPDMLKRFGSQEYWTSIQMASRYLLTELLNVVNARLAPGAPIVDANSRSHRAPLALLFAYSMEVGSQYLVWAAIAHQDEENEGDETFIHGRRNPDPSDLVISEEGEEDGGSALGRDG
ncbi:Short-chain dehydrogenase [Mycena venus]|uniref:Short-chain dehydrogenase n=1 Tax=Mycena venus TaxID=2733690 RepID=A0A8H6Z438_9AGAR|nr:Short-chain dehydrogenase [Mycena venus]